MSLILAQAEARVFSLLKTLPAVYYYHNLVHTFSFVYPRALFYGQHEKLKPSQKEILGLAALFHDTGFLDSHIDHEQFSAQRAGDFLAQQNYSSAKTKLVQKLILATCFPPKPQNQLEKVIGDADLDYLGTPYYLRIAKQLRRELCEVNHRTFTDREWYHSQIDFLTTHAYFTLSAQTARNQGKKKNLLLLQKLLSGM